MELTRLTALELGEALKKGEVSPADAIAAAPPPEEPPGTRSRSQGLRTGP